MQYLRSDSEYYIFEFTICFIMSISRITRSILKITSGQLSDQMQPPKLVKCIKFPKYFLFWKMMEENMKNIQKVKHGDSKV